MTYVLDSQSLSIFNEIRGIKNPEAASPLELAYAQLEKRIHGVLHEEISDAYAIDYLVNGVKGSRWYQWLALALSPSVRAESAPMINPVALVTSVLEAYSVGVLSPLIQWETHEWWDENLGEDVLCVVTRGTSLSRIRDYHVSAQFRLKQEECQEALIRKWLGKSGKQGELAFGSVRTPHGFMSFPSDPPGYCPEIELAAEAVGALGAYCANPRSYSPSLKVALAKYLARMTLCSLGSMSHSCGSLTGGTRVSTIAHMLEIARIDQRQVYGSVGVTSDEMNRLRAMTMMTDQYVHLITN